MDIRDLYYELCTVEHPDHEDKLADGILIYYLDDEDNPVEVGIIEMRDPILFSIQASPKTLGVTGVDLARILLVMLKADEVLSDLKAAKLEAVRSNYNRISLSEIHKYN